MHIEFEADRQKQQLSIRIFSERESAPGIGTGRRYVLIGERTMEPIPTWYTSDAPFETVTLHTVPGQ